MSRRWVYDFSEPVGGDVPLKTLLGGKGASLKEMTLAGLRVPPGFTITTECCEEYFKLGRKWPNGLEAEVHEHLARLEQQAGRAFGQGAKPLLVSVRSGAAQSMPGMMDTLLNCGLHPALASDVGDTPHFWQLYIQFIRMFARTVHGINEESFEEACSQVPRAACPPVSDVARADKLPVARSLAEAHLAAYQHLTNQPFPTQPWNLLVACINAVFESWNSERAIAYRQRNDIRGLNGTAVNVQMMFPSEMSGVVFTQDPKDIAADIIIVEAAFGLGEAVVSGDVTPDHFEVRRRDFSINKTEIGHKASRVVALGSVKQYAPDAQSLNPQQIVDLSRLSLKIEEHFGAPMDIEWGWADGGFALLQCRPIRGLEIVRDVEVGRKEEIARLKQVAAEKRHVWVTHNLAETLRFPTPLTWDIVKGFMAGDGGFGRMYQQLGYTPSDRVKKEGFLELICGRIYADPERLAEMFFDAMPLRYDLDELLADKALLDRAPAKFDPARADNRFLARLFPNLLAMWRTSRNMKRARQDAKRRFEQQVLPPYLAYVKEKRSQDLTKLGDADLLSELRQRIGKTLDEFGPESLLPGFFGGIAFDAAAGMLCQLMGDSDGKALSSTLTRALHGDTTFEQDAMLFHIAHGEETMDHFIEKFGHRCAGEMELSQPRWRESPAYPQQVVQRYKAGTVHGPVHIHRQNLDKRKAAEKSLPDELGKWGGSVFLEQIEQDLADARDLLPYRESGKYYLMMGYELIRLAIEELARRWDLGGGVYFLQLDELAKYPQERERFSEVIEKRRTRWKALQRLDLPDVIDSADLDTLGLARKIEAARELTGSAIASGAATGTVRIVFDPQEAGDLGTDYVLVCPSTDPGWTPLFLNARGLIVEKGGALSHGAIVARDFGIPAIVCPNATKLLKDGDRIRVDGNTGKVQVVDAEMPKLEAVNA